jgi:diguanylate cyclase (GGDEF)-like protein
MERGLSTCRRLCFIGSDIYVECAMAAGKMGEYLKGSGKIAAVGVIDPDNTEAAVKTRMFLTHLSDNFPDIEHAAIRGCGKYEIKARSREMTRRLLEEIPDLSGIYSNADDALQGIVEAIQETGLEGRICVVGYGNEPRIMQHVQEGRVTFALLHNRFMYGYDAVVHLYNRKAAGTAPRQIRMLTNPHVVSKETLTDFWHPDSGFIVSEETKRCLAEPVFKVPDRPLRFALHLEGVGSWFSEIIKGAMEAAKLLHNTTVTVNNWEIANLSEHDIEERREEELRRALYEKYDGVILWILNDRLIPHINRAVDRGMDVAVFHTEPVNYNELNAEVEEVYASLFRQMNLREQAEQRLRRLSNEDALTGLYTRRRINARIEEEFRALSRNVGAQLSLLMIDLDLFKHVNDAWGHLSGDICLKSVADQIRRCIRRSRDAAARWGGEEFAVVLPNTDLSGAYQIAEEIRRTIEMTPVPLQTGVVSLTISIGLASTHHNSTLKPTAWEDLVRRADEALFRAKEAGRNRVVF